MNKIEAAELLFKKGFNCTQALLATYGIELGLERNTAFKIASALGGGMAYMGETCGAVAGALMIIGLKYGVTDPVDKKARVKTYELAEKFTKKFKLRNISTMCRELLGSDIGSPGANKIIKEKCPKYVHDAAEIIEEIL